jgi:trehalose synthase
MVDLKVVQVPTRPVAQLGDVIGSDRYATLLSGADRFRARVAGRTIWNVNSTAVGGGVAEMLFALLGYVHDLDVDIRWVVIGGDPDFFAVTKRLHNRIHGLADTNDLGPDEAAHYERILAANTGQLLDLVRPGDLVLLHDPQTAGLAGALARHGARVVWRCHIGVDCQDEITCSAWEFLRPYLTSAHGYVFSRARYRPPWLPESATWIVPPSIDPYSPKNQDLDPASVDAILTTIGVSKFSSPPAAGRFTRSDGTPDRVRRTASVVTDAKPGPDDRIALQVSRWDRLKDMDGVMRAFASHVVPAGPGYLVLAGPAVSDVSDDPEGAAVYKECLATWQTLPAAARRRIMLLTLPLDDVDENAAMVNALQRRASVITQKSLAEGFGLTVAEAMWKGRPVVGSAVGGIQDQIVDGTGILLDPTDLTAFGKHLRRLLDVPEEAERMGAAAHAHVRREFLGDRHLLQYAEIFSTLLGAG